MDFVFPVTTIPALPWSAVSSIPGCQLRPSSGMCRQGLLIALGPSAAVIRVFFSSSSISDHTDLRPFSQSDRHSLHVFLLIHNSTYEVKTPIPILQSISPTNWRKPTREGGHVAAFSSSTYAETCLTSHQSSVSMLFIAFKSTFRWLLSSYGLRKWINKLPWNIQDRYRISPSLPNLFHFSVNTIIQFLVPIPAIVSLFLVAKSHQRILVSNLQRNSDNDLKLFRRCTTNIAPRRTFPHQFANSSPTLNRVNLSKM